MSVPVFLEVSDEGHAQAGRRARPVRSAARDGAALSQERYYSSYGEPAASQPRVVTVEKTDAGAWKALAVGAGALVLVLCGAELVTLGRLRSVRAT